MVKIASRPIIGKPFEYIFSIDFNGNVKDKNVKIPKGTDWEKASYKEINDIVVESLKVKEKKK